MRREGKELYKVCVIDNFQNPTVHGDLAPAMDEDDEVASEDDGC